MQCPNCYTEASSGLSRCPRCDAPLHRRPPAEEPGYDRAHEARRDGGYPGAAGYGNPEDEWEPSAQWQPDWQQDRDPARGVAGRPPEPRQDAPWQAEPRHTEPRHTEPRHTEHRQNEPWRDGPWRDEPPRKSGHPFLVAVIVGLILGGVVAGVILLWPGDDPSGGAPNSAASAAGESSPGTTESPAGAREQAAAINELLDEMAATRSVLGPAIADASRCDGIGGALEQLDQVKEERQDQLNKAKELAVDALPDGASLRKTLTRAAAYSLDVDEAFLAWAKANRGCTQDETPRDDHFTEGVDLSRDRASPEKEAFVDQWNPVAKEQGLPTRSADKF